MNMLCQRCHERNAVVHSVNIINGYRTETHLCEKCAKEENKDLFSFDFGNFNLFDQMGFGHSSFVEDLQNEINRAFGQRKDVRTNREIGSHIFDGDSSYENFRNKLMGKPYKTKVQEMDPWKDVSSSPESEEPRHERKRLEELEADLQKAVSAEEYEKAAQIKSQIDQLKKDME